MDEFRTKTRQTKAETAARPQQADRPNKTTSKSSAGKNIAVIALVIVVIMLTIGLAWTYLKQEESSSLVGVDGSKNQALFLTNGQVYFGKLSQADADTVKMSNIFYLQVQQDVQPKPKDTEETAETQLIKLGNELHGPEDEMFVDRDQVLFWENLKKDGKVSEAIADYKK